MIQGSSSQYLLSNYQEKAVREEIGRTKNYIKMKKLLLKLYPNNERTEKRKKDIVKAKKKIKELKKQLPMQVLNIQDDPYNDNPFRGIVYGNCPRCKGYVSEVDECSKCGQALKWE